MGWYRWNVVSFHLFDLPAVTLTSKGGRIDTVMLGLSNTKHALRHQQDYLERPGSQST